MVKEKVKIISNKEIAKDVFQMILHAPGITKDAYQGQFVNVGLKNESKLLKRPISINEINDEYLTLCYKINGEGTKEMSLYEKDDEIEVLGPLGKGFPINNDQNVLVIGGGIGVAPILELAKKLKDKNLTILTSYRSKEFVIYEEELKKYGKLIITTDDGSYGYKGNAIEYLNNFPIEFDCFYACGPEILLSLLEKKYEGLNGYLSYEARMACGVGLCHGCVKGDKNYCVCTDGPVFKVGVIK